jgi:hypothetical protein
MLRSLLTTLLFVLVFLIVAFAVLMGGFALADAMEDSAGATVLMWVARACLMLIVVNVVLLVGVLAVHALIREQQDRRDSEP